MENGPIALSFPTKRVREPEERTMACLPGRLHLHLGNAKWLWFSEFQLAASLEKNSVFLLPLHFSRLLLHNFTSFSFLLVFFLRFFPCRPSPFYYAVHRSAVLPPFSITMVSRGFLISLLVLAVLLPLVCGGKTTSKHSGKGGKHHGKEQAIRRSMAHDGRVQAERSSRVRNFLPAFFFLGSLCGSLNDLLFSLRVFFP